MLWNRTPSTQKVVDQIHLHVYSADGLQVECDVGHDMPAEIRQRGFREVYVWAADHCPRLRAALDANQRRN